MYLNTHLKPYAYVVVSNRKMYKRGVLLFGLHHSKHCQMSHTLIRFLKVQMISLSNSQCTADQTGWGFP